MNNNVENSNALNLNSLPGEFSVRDNGKETQFVAGSSSSGLSSRKNKKKDDESRKVYECRFCSLKFCKSQALGGHMNRHRPERETETLNKARMLVFSNENTLPTVHHSLPAAHHLGGFNQPVIGADPTLQFRPAYQPQPVTMRLPSSAVLHLQQIPPPQPYMYPSPPPPPHYSLPYPPQYRPSTDYCNNITHVLGTTGPEPTTYTCIGAPVVGPSGGFSSSTNGSVSDGRHNGNQQDDGMSWGMRGMGGSFNQQQLQQPTRLDLSLAINRFQDRF